jgi:hypothetical protein
MLRAIVGWKAYLLAANDHAGSYTLMLECGHEAQRKPSRVRRGQKAVQCRECDREFDRALELMQEKRLRDGLAAAMGLRLVDKHRSAGVA